MIEIEKQIKELRIIKSEWLMTRMQKSKVHDLVNKIKMFNHTFSVNFPTAVKYYRRNSFPEINITDGIGELNNYSNSKLKQKDNHYFHEGITNVTNGIQKIIDSLENDLKSID